MDLRLYRDTGSFIGMTIITTPNNYQVAQVEDVFIRLCKQCGGSGEYSFNHLTGDSFCYRCMGVGYMGKEFSSVEEAEKACIAYEKAAERREAKRQAEWEAGREEREAEEAQRAIQAAEREAELATWKHLDAQVGDKVTVTGTVAVAISVETQFGISRLIVVNTDNNEAVKMFTTASWAWDVNRDDNVTIQGDVKSFDEYEGKAQTMLNRPKSI